MAPPDQRAAPGVVLARLAAVHAVVWTVVPALTQQCAPLDVVILAYWGRQPQWGYPRHPPLPAWLAAAVWDGAGVWAVYLLSQLMVLAAVWAAWRLGRELLGEVAALPAAAALEGVFYYNFTTPEFNNNVALLACWALAVWFGWVALRTGRTRAWLALGLAVGAGLLSKYSLAFLAVPLLAFTLLHPQARQCWRSPGPYLALLVAAGCFGPHCQWAAAHHWITLRYAAERGGGPAGLGAHLLHPLRFAADQALTVLPLVLALAPLLGRRPRPVPGDLGRAYLSTVVLAPVALHLVVAALTGMKLRNMWGTPLWTFLGVYLLVQWGTRIEPDRVRRSLRLSGALAVLAVVALIGRNVVAPRLTGRGERVNCPGPALAALAEQAWRDTVGGPLPVVAGPGWLAGQVALYGRDRAVVYAELDPAQNDWITDSEFRARGGLILWYADPSGRQARSDQAPAALAAWLARFPAARLLPPWTLAWPVRGPREPLRLQAAVVPPGAP